MAIAARKLEAGNFMVEKKTALEARVENIQGDVAEMKSDIRRLDSKLESVRAELTADIKALGSKLESFREKVEEKFTRLEEKLAGKLSSLEDRFAGKFTALEDKFASLDHRVANLSGMQKATLWMLSVVTALLGTLVTLLIRGAHLG